MATAVGRYRAICSAMRSALLPAASATTRSLSGCASTTASALWPIEPVDPRMASRFMQWSGLQDQIEKQVERRARKEQRVDAIEHAAMSRDQRRSVLDAGNPLQPRLEHAPVSPKQHDRHSQAEQHLLPRQRKNPTATKHQDNHA